MLNRFVFLIVVMLLCSCSQTFTYNRAAYWTGEGWYHPDKTQKEVQKDFYECIEKAYKSGKLYTNMITETNCMKANGYAWK